MEVTSVALGENQETIIQVLFGFLVLGSFTLCLIGTVAAARSWLLRPVAPRLAVVARRCVVYHAICVTAFGIACLYDFTAVYGDWTVFGIVATPAVIGGVAWSAVLFAPRREDGLVSVAR